MTSRIRSCRECPVKDYLDMAKGCKYIESIKENFSDVCRRCKEERVVKGLQVGDDNINTIGSLSDTLADKISGVHDEGDEEVLQKRSRLLLEKDEPRTREIGDRDE